MKLVLDLRVQVVLVVKVVGKPTLEPCNRAVVVNGPKEHASV